MLCSISTGKSGSKWLDRLRSSKGFPAGNDLDLEQFLNHHSPKLPNSSNSNLSNANIGQKSKKPDLDRNQTTTMDSPQEDGEREWFGIMSNVLADLFNMGDLHNFPRIHPKKCSRKQSNPRICIVSTPSNVESAIGDSRRANGCVEMKQTSDRLRLMKEESVDVEVGCVDVEEDEKSHADLLGFSRTDVTVIDSSYPSWKCEKLLFRRKNVWKVREKKRKSINFGVKKRKANALEVESGGGQKKLKRCNSSKDGNGEAHMMMPSNNVHLQSDKMSKDSKEMPDILSEVPKMRFPRKSKKCGSSVVLIKSVPTSKKNGANIL